MSQLLISLPPDTQFDQFTPLQLKHPKGQTVTFLAREDKLYELNHRKVETNMCFSTMNDKTTIQQPALIQATEFDIMYLLIPLLEESKEKGKITIENLEIKSTKLRSIAERAKFEAFCETSELEGTLYVKLSEEKLNEELDRRHKALLEIMDKNEIMSDYSNETKTYHAAKAICDCLSKTREMSLLKHLKLDEHIVDDAPPPVKKSKKSDGTSEPTEDYSGKENIAIVKPVDSKKAAHQKKMKSAAKGTKGIMSFFTPKKK